MGRPSSRLRRARTMPGVDGYEPSAEVAEIVGAVQAFGELCVEQPDLGDLYLGARRAWLAAKQQRTAWGMTDAHQRIEAAVKRAESSRASIPGAAGGSPALPSMTSSSHCTRSGVQYAARLVLMKITAPRFAVGFKPILTPSGRSASSTPSSRRRHRERPIVAQAAGLGRTARPRKRRCRGRRARPRSNGSARAGSTGPEAHRSGAPGR